MAQKALFTRMDLRAAGSDPAGERSVGTAATENSAGNGLAIRDRTAGIHPGPRETDPKPVVKDTPRYGLRQPKGGIRRHLCDRVLGRTTDQTLTRVFNLGGPPEDRRGGLRGHVMDLDRSDGHPPHRCAGELTGAVSAEHDNLAGVARKSGICAARDAASYYLRRSRIRSLLWTRRIEPLREWGPYQRRLNPERSAQPASG